MFREVAFKEIGRADGRAHQQESRLRECEERNLPGDTALAVGIVVELVHHHVHDVEFFALVERHVGENFRCAAQNGCVVVHGRIAGRKAYVLGTKFLAERHPLLVHQRLDGAGVHALAAMHDAVEVERQGDHRLAATRGRVQDDVLAVQKFEDGFFLSGVQRCPARLRPFHELLQDVLGADFRTVPAGCLGEFLDGILENGLVLLCHRA